MKHSVIGMDIAKDIFQLHSVDESSGKVQRHRLCRDRVMDFFAQHRPCVVAMEACGGAHWWARQLRSLGHEPKLIRSEEHTSELQSH